MLRVCLFFYCLCRNLTNTLTFISNQTLSSDKTQKALKKTHKNHLHKQPVALESEKYNIQTELNLLCSLQQTSVFS